MDTQINIKENMLLHQRLLEGRILGIILIIMIFYVCLTAI